MNIFKKINEWWNQPDYDYCKIRGLRQLSLYVEKLLGPFCPYKVSDEDIETEEAMEQLKLIRHHIYLIDEPNPFLLWYADEVIPRLLGEKP